MGILKEKIHFKHTENKPIIAITDKKRSSHVELCSCWHMLNENGKKKPTQDIFTHVL